MSYLPLTEKDRKEILETIGVSSFDDIVSCIPNKLRDFTLNIPEAISDMQLSVELQKMANMNKGIDKVTSFVGAGAYEHFIPSVVKHIVTRSEFYTAYTPYQAEASQGILQAIYEYQTMICKITAMDVSNASHYDGATSLVEAVIMAANVKKRKKILVSSAVNPQYLEVLQTYLAPSEIEVIKINFSRDYLIDKKQLVEFLDSETAAFVAATPNFFGVVEDFTEIEKMVHDNDSLFILNGNLMSFAKYKSPGEWSADIACGEAQVFGNKLNFGGPYLGYIAVNKKLMRKLPGRIVGMTVDKDGKRAFVLTLQAREQHIRREKATSNICSNQALCALAALVHIVALGQKGYERVFDLNKGNAEYLRDSLKENKSLQVYEGNIFNEFVVEFDKPANEIIEKCLKEDIYPGFDLSIYFPKMKNALLICATEMRTREELNKLVNLLQG